MRTPPPAAAEYLLHRYNDGTNDRVVSANKKHVRFKTVIDRDEAARIEDTLERLQPDYAKAIRGEIRRLDRKGTIALTDAGKAALKPALLSDADRQKFADRLALEQETLKLVRNMQTAPQLVNERADLAAIEQKLAPDVEKLQKIVRTGRAGNTPVPGRLDTPLPDTFDRLVEQYGPAVLHQLNALDWQHLNPLTAAAAVPLARALIQAAK